MNYSAAAVGLGVADVLSLLPLVVMTLFEGAVVVGRAPVDDLCARRPERNFGLVCRDPLVHHRSLQRLCLDHPNVLLPTVGPSILPHPPNRGFHDQENSVGPRWHPGTLLVLLDLGQRQQTCRDL
jgi:hypothetical protein